MKLSVLTVCVADKTFEEALSYLSGLGVQQVELGAGGFPGKAHIDPEVLLSDEAELQNVKDLLAKYNMEISALAVHGNPVHPQKEVAQKADYEYRQAVLLAEKLGVKTVITFSGCPGDQEGAKYPNWVTCPWPDDFLSVLDYQWNDVLIPYWKEAVSFAESHGVRVALEMHPGFCVYNPTTMMRLREAVGNNIGANFDPSHLYWQGIDIVAAIRYLGDAIFHFHAKDTKVDALNTGICGVLDTKHYGDELHRSWIFRSLGYGHGIEEWKDIVSNLRMVGYEGAVSIEHEDSLMTGKEGLEKAVNLLKEAMLFEQTGEMWWA